MALKHVVISNQNPILDNMSPFLYGLFGHFLASILLVWALIVSILNLHDEIMGVFTIDSATNRMRCAKNLPDGAREVLGKGLWSDDARSIVNVLHGDVAIVTDVLHLLAVPVGLLQGLDDQGCRGGAHRNRGLPVLDGELDGDLQSFPVTSCLGNVLTNFLW